MKRRESIRHRSWTCSEGFRVNVARAAPVLLAFVVQPGPLIFTRGAAVSTVIARGGVGALFDGERVVAV